MRAITIWELRQRRTAILWWTIGTIGLIAMLLLIYPSIHDQAKQLNAALNQLPDSLKALKTGGTNVDITSPIGYLHSQIFYITIPLLWIIVAVTRGSGLLGREEQTKTIELLLARPISRGRLLAGKALSGIVEMTLYALAAIVTMAAVAPLVDLHVTTKDLTITTVYTALFCLSFGIIAFTLNALGRLTKRASTAIAVSIAFGGYVIASLSGLSDWLELPAKLVPYHYFYPETLLQGTYSTGLNVYLVCVLVLGALLSYIGFRRRDIN